MIARLAAMLSVLALAISIHGSTLHKAPPSPSFYKDVLPILQDHCQSCHRSGEVAPMPLETYEQTRHWARALDHEVEMKIMPPCFADEGYASFLSDISLSERQIATIVEWASHEALAGNPHDSPPPRRWAEGWN